jgi:AMP nucleosidase
MKSRKEIVANWLPRYTGVPLNKFGEYILLTNFDRYVNLFAQWHRVPIMGRDKPMPSATAGDITIINFGMGSATAATVMDLLSAVKPKAVLFLGKCGGVKHRAEIGDLILPIAAVRGEGASNDYFPPEVPALPSFALQKAISTTIRDHSRDYWTGTIYTTNRRVWEHDEIFKRYLKKIRVIAVDMETATIFTTGFYNEITTGALLLVSDQPMTPRASRPPKATSGSTKVRHRPPPDRHRLAEAADQQGAHGETPEILARCRSLLSPPGPAGFAPFTLAWKNSAPEGLGVARSWPGISSATSAT